MKAPPLESPPMKFQRVRLLDAACEPNCPEWLSAEGAIVRGSAQQLRQALAQFGDHKIPLLINSPGGLVDEGLAMGRIVRERRMAVGVAKTMFVSCVPGLKHCDQGALGEPVAPGAFCFSACVFVLAGGVDRFASPLSAVGVHQARADGPKTIIRKLFRVNYKIENGQKREVSRELMSTQTVVAPETASDLSQIEQSIKAYYAEMGIDGRVWDLSLATPPSGIYIIRAADLRSMRLATSDPSPFLAVERTGKDTRIVATFANPAAPAPAPQIVEVSGDWPLPFELQRRGVELEAKFTFTPGESVVVGAFTVREAVSRLATDVRGTGLTLLLRPLNVSFRTEKTYAASTLHIAIPRAQYCTLKTDGVMVVTFSDRSGLRDAEIDAERSLQGEPPVEIDPRASAAFRALTAAACSDAGSATAARFAPAPASAPTSGSQTFAATGRQPFALASRGRSLALDATLSFTKGASSVIGVFSVRDLVDYSKADVYGTGLTLLLKPEDAVFRADGGSSANLRVAVPLADFCKLRTEGTIVATFSERAGLTGAERGEELFEHGEPPLEINPRAFAGSDAVFAAACSEAASAASANVTSTAANPASAAPQLIDASGVLPLPSASRGRQLALEAKFSFATKASVVVGDFAVRDVLDRSLVRVRGTGLTLLLLPENAWLHAELAGETSSAQIEIPRDEFCKLTTDGLVVATYSNLSGVTEAEANRQRSEPEEPPLEINPRSFAGSAALFAAACPDRVSSAAK